MISEERAGSRSADGGAHPVVANPPPIPLVVYDGDCSFCKLWVLRWRRRLGGRVAFAPYQEVAPHFPALPIERFRAAVQRIEPDGSVSQGAEAVFRTLAAHPRGGLGWALYRSVPGAAPLFELGYRWVANHRSLLYPPTRWVLGQGPRDGRSQAGRGPTSPFPD